MKAAMVTIALALGVTADAASEVASVGDVSIQGAWARASLGPAPNSAIYMVLETSGEEPDRLIGGSTPVAQSVQLHAHTMEDGIARMRPVDAIEVAPGGPTVLQPGGLHLMLAGLRQTLAAGETLPLTLEFENAGEVTLEVPIRSMTGGMGHGGHGAMHHGGDGAN